MSQLKISAFEGLVMFLTLSAAQATPCPPCFCESQDGINGWILNCSSLGLKKMPPLAWEFCHSGQFIRIIHLQNNSLTSIPVGALDDLVNLEEADFSNNPWHCDCSILYFKRWLEDISQASLASVTCASPAFVKGKTLDQLSGNELEGCRKPLPTILDRWLSSPCLKTSRELSLCRTTTSIDGCSF
uniref:Glycoprotein IX platelet n=1 Tax=Salvator merianae TaxID=96440 RepID=A0A8D0E1R9_SALMN